MTLNEPAEQDGAMRPQTYTKHDKQLNEAGGRRNSLLNQGRGTYQLIVLCQVIISPENTYTNNIAPTKQVAFKNICIYMYMYIQKHICMQYQKLKKEFRKLK